MAKLAASGQALTPGEGRDGLHFDGRVLDGLVGHTAPVAALLRAVESARFPQALIFSGPSGVGKRRVAIGLAQALVCEVSRRACGACGPCLRVAHGQSESLRVVEPQGVAIKVEQARETLSYLSLQKLGRARVVIFDQSHLMNPQAANALLKALEEPPENVHFIMVTSQASSLLATVRSRAQTIRFGPLTSSELKRVLGSLGERAKSVDDETAMAARGSVEQALLLLEESATSQEARTRMVDLLASPADAFPTGAITRLKEACSDRPAGLAAARCALEIGRSVARQALLGKAASEVPDLARDAAAAVLSSHRGLDASAGLALGDLALAAERDILGNVDRGLVFECLWLDWARLASQAV